MSDNADEYLKRGNLLWEGSRMFLPEHREQLLERRRSRREFRMPELDEDWLDKIGRALADSLANDQPITIVYGTKYETQRLAGIVRRINPYDRWVQIECINSDPDDDGYSRDVRLSGSQTIQIAWRRIVEIQEM